ncbi:MAG TPA: carboxypeptidase-like regulatory domain-containing protein, partial [Longimicrobiales bacterium]|nr:carboxypeptidase-like regulatory domain-containing protein [Longimicrobiales bacterium]
MNWYRRAGSFLLTALLVFGVYAEASAQASGTIRGRITDQMSGQPISGVQISVTGTQRGTVTDQNGVFLIP